MTAKKQIGKGFCELAYRLIRGLFFLNALVWVAFGILSLARMGQGSQLSTVALVVIAILMFANAGAMLLAGWGLGRKNKWFFFFAVAVLAVNILLTFTDQVGPWDLVTLLIDLGLLGLLIANRSAYSNKTLST